MTISRVRPCDNDLGEKLDASRSNELAVADLAVALGAPLPPPGSVPVVNWHGTVVGHIVPRRAESDAELRERIRAAHHALYPPDPTPNLTALSLAVADVLYDFAEVFATAYRFWRTDPDVISAVEAVADHRVGGRVSHGRLGRAYVLAWRNDYLGLRSRWVMRAYRAESVERHTK